MEKADRDDPFSVGGSIRSIRRRKWHGGFCRWHCCSGIGSHTLAHLVGAIPAVIAAYLGFDEVKEKLPYFSKKEEGFPSTLDTEETPQYREEAEKYKAEVEQLKSELDKLKEEE
jgi:hypothetical protein